ncbi:MAG TPA: CoA transferase [Beijerinckiaceae bacterium]|jgi:crotonobetainyl-CoA:carnitine CoA-transferase CaiB-like acyl-CoA transferase
MHLPLHGITVLDFSTLLPGPLATFMLAEAGAEVIKVERPGGEDMRRFPPRLGQGSAAFAVLNAGKRSVVADLKTAEGRAALRPLIERADILVEQFRPGVMDRLGLGWDDVRTLNPRLIYCSVSGYGQEGPRAQEAGHDINYQARAGLLSLSPGSTGSPSVPAALVADVAGGSFPAVINILLALRRRDMTGEGCRIDVAMVDAMFTFAWLALAEGFAGGRFPGSQENMLAGGSPRYALYATADGQFLAVGALEEKFWGAFCHGIGLPERLRDDRADPAATRAAIVSIVRGKSAAEWRAILEPLDCCATILASLAEAVDDPQFRDRGLFRAQAAGPDGAAMPAVAVPIAPDLRRPLDEPRAVPPIGEVADVESAPAAAK